MSDQPPADTMDIATHRAAWSGFMTFIQYGGLLTVLLIAHVILTAALGIDPMVSLMAIAVIGFIAKQVMQMTSAMYVCLIGMCVAISIAHMTIWLVGMILV